jgi:hypothetical protein
MRLHFTIRDLLWLTLVVALAAGWWLEHRFWINRADLVVNVYPIQSANPNATLKVVRSALAGQPNSRAEIDSTTGNLVVSASPSQQVIVRSIVDKIRGSSSP